MVSKPSRGGPNPLPPARTLTAPARLALSVLGWSHGPILPVFQGLQTLHERRPLHGYLLASHAWLAHHYTCRQQAILFTGCKMPPTD